MASIGQRYTPSNCKKKNVKCREILRNAEKFTEIHINVEKCICRYAEKFEEPCRIFKKLVPSCVVIVSAIHAKVLLGSVLYVED